MTNAVLETYRSAVHQELENILRFWTDRTFDDKHGGFIGKMDIQGQIDANAPKGLVLNARILWTFSAAYQHTQNPRDLAAAQRAFAALAPFKDAQWGGHYWSTEADGTPLEERKQIYGLAFVLYGLSEFYKISKDAQILEECWAIYRWIEKNSFNPKNKGYLEAVARDGSALEDLRLSAKDLNAPLSMNTHLHILEAYTNLYRIAPDEALKGQLENLVDVFLGHIIDSDSKHLHLFFDEKWQPIGAEVSYGHDIEAAWLLLEAAEAIHYRVSTCQKTAVEIAEAVLPALDGKGGLDYEAHRRERHWWVQAEAMVGFLNAYQVSKEVHFLEKSALCWDFIQQYMLDHTHGEWFWGYTADGQLMQAEDKVGFWKCPYHNARACMEVERRMVDLLIG